jgi:hypothetical protein
MITPKLNINGSSAADLINPRIKAVDHLMDAIAALSEAAPHSRDYPSGYTAFIADIGKYYDRITAISLICKDIQAEAQAIIKQRDQEA